MLSEDELDPIFARRLIVTNIPSGKRNKARLETMLTDFKEKYNRNREECLGFEVRDDCGPMIFPGWCIELTFTEKLAPQDAKGAICLDQSLLDLPGAYMMTSGILHAETYMAEPIQIGKECGEKWTENQDRESAAHRTDTWPELSKDVPTGVKIIKKGWQFQGKRPAKREKSWKADMDKRR